MAQSFDVVVIGAGPGGYIAAIRAAQLGQSVACIDEWKNAKGGPAPGGTCTNVGCIPSKALLQSSEHFEQAGHHFADHGIGIKGLSLDLKKMLARKALVVKQNNDGILYLFKKNKVAFFHGRGAFAGPGKDAGYEISVSGAKPETLIAKHVIIATGSSPRALPGAPFDEKQILSNDGALSIEDLPKTLGLIGAGVIGLEMGSVWRRLGSEVTILEALPAFLGAADEQIAAEARKAFSKQALNVELGVRIGAVRVGKNVSVDYTSADGTARSASFDKLVVSIGRLPNTTGLGHASAGLKLDERGFVAVDERCRTNLPNVWAVGDVVRGPMLAHKAEEEGVAVAERIAGQAAHVDFNTIPWVIYTSPEIAWVGQTEQALKAAGRAYKAGSFPFAANGRARALGDTTGMVKILADAVTDEILGVHIVGPLASELIAEAVVAMEFRASAEDIARICHAHPTLSEATREAALAVDKRTLNL
jgi:dihydrolipoamide dehydrogenase